MEDLFKFPALVSCLQEIQPYLETIRLSQTEIREKQLELYKLTTRLSELESFILCVDKLHQVFAGTQEKLTSAG